MAGQAGFFDAEERLGALSAAGDPLERLGAVLDFELFRAELEAALPRADRSRGGRPPYDAVLMFRVLVLQALYTLSDEQTEYQLRAELAEAGVPVSIASLWRFFARRQITLKKVGACRRAGSARRPDAALRMVRGAARRAMPSSENPRRTESSRGCSGP